MHRFVVLLLLPMLLQACGVAPPEPGFGEPVSWEQLSGWDTGQHAGAWPALLNTCSMTRERPDWRRLCEAAEATSAPTNDQAKAFIETHFRAHPVYGEQGRRRGLITGYYEPLLHGSFEPGERYRYPLYAPPADLLSLDLGDVYPELADRQLRGKLSGRTVVPYPDRARLASSPGKLAGSELIWVDDPVDAFFLHVQGSGRVILPDGDMVAVGFADHNGRPYRSIGRHLTEMGALEPDEVNLFSIRRWLRRHPRRMAEVLNHNPRYVFFRLSTGAGERAPTGSMGVPLTPGRSLAVDKRKIPLGAPVWLETTMPGSSGAPLNRLMVAQDTGGAIQGYLRADVFWGRGDDAERKAGLMNERGRMFVLVPRGQH